MKLSKHFSSEEFVCRCGCGLFIYNKSLVDALESFRVLLGNIPIYINSGTRCREYNTAIGGAPNSKHLTGEAADISVIKLSGDTKKAFTGMELLKFLLAKKPAQIKGIGIGKNFLHIDVRNTMSEIVLWTYTGVLSVQDDTTV
ncbi:MAG: D-Ala-D-Ala carboxypeptidase family metallohydrolase [Bacteroidales bacterium]